MLKHEKIKILSNILLKLLIQLRFLHTTHTQDDLLNLSFLNEILKFSVFSSKIEKHSCQKNCALCRSFWSKSDSDLFSTSKWRSEPQFCEKYKCSLWRNDQKWLWNGQNHRWVRFLAHKTIMVLFSIPFYKLPWSRMWE